MASNPWVLPDGFDADVRKALKALKSALNKSGATIPDAAFTQLRLGNIEGFLAFVDWDKIRGGMEGFEEVLIEAAQKAGTSTFTLGGVDAELLFDLIDERAVIYAQERVGQLIVEITDQMRETVRQTIAAAERGEMTYQMAALQLQNTIPLTTRDANAVTKFTEKQFQRFMREGLSEARARIKAQNMAAQYAAKLLDARTRTIARTEIIDASMSGRYLGWEAGVTAGYISNDSVKEWIAEPDACPICRELDGKLIGWNQEWEFPEGVSAGSTNRMPPAHPNCRCAVVILPPDYADDVFTPQSGGEMPEEASEFLKHLTGQHDQKTHGRGHSTERPYELQPLRQDPKYTRVGYGEWSEYAQEGRGPSAYRLGNYGSTGVDGSSPITDYGGTAKARTEFQLARRAAEDAGTNRDFMIEIANDPDYPKIPKAVLESSLKEVPWNQNGTMTLENLDAERLSELNHFAFRNWSDLDAKAAYLAKENKFVSDKLREMKFANGQTVGEVVDGLSNSVLEQMQVIATDNAVSLTMPASKLERFIDEDHYRTAYETKLSGKGANRKTYMERREDFENNKMGVPATTADSERPIYGVIGKQGMTYGDTQVIFKDDIKHRTTATIGDSLDGNLTGAHWLQDYADSKVTVNQLWDSHGTLFVNTLGNNNRSGSTFIWEKPDETGMVPWGSIKGFSGKADLPAIGKYGYIETQIHGGVSLKDVAAVVIPSSNAISRSAQQTLAEQGIEVIVGSHIEKSQYA